ncbi:AGAP000976-PA [Anopheles gambiae str. PEST]|uniref:AGAP000976-PA n=2 Tax=gambiae species complex TaxID=44542 RepID=A0NBS0_ANOGA|nr:AGAP000976-PA [Anopheles gambiae str. PEST]
MMVHLGKYGAREEFFPQKASVWALKSNDVYGDSNNNNHPDRRWISVGCIKTASRCTRSRNTGRPVRHRPYRQPGGLIGVPPYVLP